MNRHIRVLSQAFRGWLQHRRGRRQLEALDDHMLADIGVIASMAAPR